jgi:hypothetical protein
MRTTTLLFIIFQLGDLFTTGIGIIFLGLQEINPLVVNWNIALLVKVVVIIFVSIILQSKRQYKFDYIVPFISGIVVIWNVVNIVLEILI